VGLLQSVHTQCMVLFKLDVYIGSSGLPRVEARQALMIMTEELDRERKAKEYLLTIDS